jgi:predicted nucleic acid-binding protein
MSKSKVYIESSVISYLTARASRDVVVAGHQQITREWWDNDKGQFDLFISSSVIREVGGGDPEAAQERLRVIAGFQVLTVGQETGRCVQALLSGGALPAKAAEDALHIVLAATNGMDYLLTWNCKHIANATMRKTIERILRELGLQSPVICTPDELRGATP